MKLLFFFICLSVCLSASITRNPYLQNGSPYSMTVMWRTENSTTGTVEFGETISYGSSLISPVGNLHEVEITGLSPNTKYFYKVTSDGDTESSWFRTFPVSSDAPVTFAVSGDTRNSTSYLADDNLAIQAWQAGHEPHFNLNNGDIVEDGEPLTGSYWQAFFDTTSNLIAQSPCYITTGNHDYEGEILSPGYAENFSFPKNGPVSLSERVYSFDCGNVHVTAAEIHYNPNTPYLPGTEQFDFITNDFASTDKPWKIFVMHHPIFSSGRSGYLSDNEWARTWATNMFNYYVPEFEKYGINLVISGHDHFYERSIKDNITYLIVATKTGEKLNQPNPYHVYGNESGGGMVFSITGRYMYGTAARKGDGENNVEVIDSFIITNNSSVCFTSSNYSVNENDGSIDVFVARSGNDDFTTTVHYGTLDGTASNGQDYTEVSGELSWLTGDTSIKPINISIIENNINESSKTFYVVLNSPTNAFLVSPSMAEVTINAIPEPGIFLSYIFLFLMVYFSAEK